MRRMREIGWGWLWGLPTVVLATSLFVTGALAEEEEPEATEDTTAFDVLDGRKVTTNEDGSIAVNSTVTTTNTETGTGRTAVNETTVQKTETGRSWTRNSAVNGSNGFSQNSSTTGASTNNGAGSGSWGSITNGVVTRPTGNSVDYSTERAGEWSKNDQGGRDIGSTATTTTSNGGTTTVNRNLSTYQVSDGVKGFTGDTSRSLGNGANIDRSIDGSVTKTDTGRNWETTIDGTATGPNGNTHSWTTDIDGSVTKNEDGSRSLDVEKTVTSDKGGTTTVDKEGTFTKGADGSWHYEGTKEVTHTPPTTPPETATTRSATQNADLLKATNLSNTAGNVKAEPTPGPSMSSKKGTWNRWKEQAASGANGNAEKWAQWKEKSAQNQQNGGARDRVGEGQGGRIRNAGGNLGGARSGTRGGRVGGRR